MRINQVLKSFRVYILLIQVLTAVLPLMGIGILVTGSVSDNLKRGAEREHRTMTETFAGDVSRLMQSAEQITRLCAVHAEEDFVKMRSQDIQEELDRTRAGFPMFGHLFWVDRSGSVSVQSPAENQVQDMTAGLREWLQQTIEDRQDDWSGVQLNSGKSRAFILYVFSTSHGAVVADMDPDVFRQYTAVLAPKDSQIEVMDENAVWISHPSKLFVLEARRDASLEGVLPGLRDTVWMTRNIIRDNVRWIETLYYMKDTGWTVRFVQKETAVFGQVQTVATMFRMGVLLNFLLVMGFALLTYRRLTREIVALDSAVRRTSPGESAGRPAFREFVAVEDSFTGILEQLQRTTNRAIEGETRLRAVFDAMPGGIVLLDKNGLVVDANPMAREWLGISGFQGKPFGHYPWFDEHDQPLSQSDLPDEIFRRFRVPVRNVTLWRSEHGIRRLPLMINIDAVQDTETSQGGFVMSVADVREIREAHQHIQEINENLEKLVHERTRQLERTVEELEAFSYSVSHDLRAPLRAVDGFSQALMEDYCDALPDGAKHCMDRISQSARRMSELIDDLLGLARLSRMEMSREEVDISILFERTVGQLLEAAGRTNTEVRLENKLYAWCDRRMVTAALENLISNAIKFTSKTTSPVIAFGVRSISGGRRVFFIRDNGAGFDQKLADRLFMPFQRLHTDKEFEGHGIGLANVRRIIQRHGGEIWAEGEVDAGAVFWFTLPS